MQQQPANKRKANPDCPLCHGEGIIVKDEFQKNAPRCHLCFPYDGEAAMKKKPESPAASPVIGDKREDIEKWIDGEIKSLGMDVTAYHGIRAKKIAMDLYRMLTETKAPMLQKAKAWIEDEIQHLESISLTQYGEGRLYSFKRIAEVFVELTASPPVIETEEHIHVNLPSGAVARVAPDASPELLGALNKMVELAKDVCDKEPRQIREEQKKIIINREIIIEAEKLPMSQQDYEKTIDMAIENVISCPGWKNYSWSVGAPVPQQNPESK